MEEDLGITNSFTQTTFMCSLHIVHTINAYRADHVCPFVHMFQLEERIDLLCYWRPPQTHTFYFAILMTLVLLDEAS